jgi:hypothetical protein
VSLGGEILSGTPVERFEWSIDVFINGMLSTQRK